MNRVIVYPGAIPQDSDLLNTNRDALIAFGWLIQATLGTSTGVVGLPCNPTSPASMNVVVGPGALWTLSTIDANAYGSLPIDTSALMKMGILPEAAGTTFTLTAPSTSGDSINYLIEGAFSEVDGGSTVLPYYNASNPASPYSGPNGSGTSQNTVRQGLVALQLKAGAAAPTGTQTTPAVDAGYTGLYVVTVAYGQVSITSGNITTYAGAPFYSGPFAQLAGSASQTFSVANATTGSEAVNLGQLTGGALSPSFDNLNATTGVFNNVVVETSSNSFTPAAGVTKVKVTVIAGGAGGGAGGGSAGGGGGGGGWAFGVVSVTPGTPVAFTVGSGGTGGVNGGAAATNGGNSTFGSITADGGTAGSPGTNSTTIGIGGAGGSATGGTWNQSGFTGQNGILIGTSVIGGFSGAAYGCGPNAGPAGNTSSVANGIAGGFPGQGGTGGIGTGNGGAGANGIIIIEY